uniref:Uncharacterized protein n=1 Tax=Panagrolaimus superbus TaxID=310955 RepID=A0A914XWJ8_9BILA
MAKQVLDLYELYHLVVKHGGLVEIINKKLWREITKGLNLPPSITSAAFTLRTQYQRYLYDYECDKMNLSSPPDLMTAIESNKREGRRNPTGGSLGGSGGSGNGMMNGSLHNGSGGLNPWGMPSIFGRFGSPFGMRPEDETALASLSNAQHALAAGMDPQKQMEFFQRAAAEAATRHPAAMAAAVAAAAASNRSGRSSVDSTECTPTPNPNKFTTTNSNKRPLITSATESRPIKMPKLEKPSTTNMKLTTKDNQMYVSMEVNGTMYQGILFAMPNVNSNNGKINNHIVNGRSTSNSPSPQNFNPSLSEGIDMEALSALFGTDMSKFNPTSTAASE